MKRLLQSHTYGLGIYIYKRSLSSALYVTGDKASETYSVLTPHLDFDERLKDIASLTKNVNLRGMDLNVNELKKLWDFMKDVQAKKKQLEERRVDVANKMRLLKLTPSDNEVEMKGRKLRIEGKMIREDLKVVMKGLWELEGNAIIRALALPNHLHADTPSSKEVVIHEFGTKSDCSCENHLKKGDTLNIIKYCNQLNYYLLGNAACFEFGTLHYFGQELEKCGLLQFCNADFVRSVIVEGIGMKHDHSMGAIILRREDDCTSDDDRLHLVGGASLASFSAFHTKQSIPSQSLPLSYYTIGRQYIPQPRHADGSGLFNVWQASAVEVFVCTSDDFHHMMQAFNSLLNTLISVYECLGLHFRVVYLPGNALNQWESLRASIQMFSSHYHSYIEVGNLSICDDYISKRLLMTYKDNDRTTDRCFVNIVSGTAVSIPKLLGCILEQNEDDVLFIPEPIKPHIVNTL